MKKIGLVLGFVLFLSVSFQVNAQWFWQNPLPQGNNLMDIQHINDINGFACGENGTFIKTMNGGAVWLVLPFPETFNLVGMNFLTSTIGWVRGKKGNNVKLYKTTDSGDSWTEQFSSQAQYISSFFINESLGWLSSDGNLFQSTDGGTSWIQKHTLDPITDITFIDSMNGWAATNNYKIYYTSDGGVTWQFSSVSSPLIWKLKFFNNSIGWLVNNNNNGPNISSASIWKTTDCGLTWQQQFEYSGWGYQYFFTDLDFINESIGLVVSPPGKIFKTSNGGSNWDEVSNAENLFALTTLNESIMWGCGLYGVQYFSANGGFSWQKNYQGELIYETSELFVLDENYVFIGGNGTLLKTQTGGNNWEKIDLNVPNQSYLQARAIWFTDQLHGWAGLELEGGHGAILRTTDGGSSWMNQVDSIYRVFDITFINNTTGWFISGDKIYKTTDGGINWLNQSQLSEVELVSLQFIDNNIGWTGGYIGLYKTEDGGNSWNEVFPLGIDISVVGIHFLNQIEGWVITNGGSNGPGIFKTTDGGISWVDQSITNSIGIYYNDLFFIDNSEGWLVGSDALSNALLLYTSDGGNNWNAMYFPSSHYLDKISFINENDGWILGERGTILHTTNGGVTFIEDENNPTQPIEFLLQQNYPNPFNPSTKISWQAPVSGWQTLKVYDILGNEVATLVDEYRNAGSYNVQFRINNVQLSSGVYFYQLRAGEFVETRKMILLK